MRPRSVALLACLIAGITASSSHAAAWTTPTTLSTAGVNAADEKTVVRPDGSAVAAWGEGVKEVYVAVRPAGAGASFGTAQHLDTVSAPGGMDSLQLGVDSAGNVLAVWHRSDIATNAVKWARLPAGSSTFAGPTTIGSSGSQPTLAMSSGGIAWMAWLESNGTVIKTDQMPAGASAFSGPSPLVTAVAGHTLSFPTMAVDANGNMLAAWMDNDTPDFITHIGNWFLRARRVSAGGVAGSVQPIETITRTTIP